MEFVLDLGIPNVARATLQQAIMSMMEWHHTGLYHPCFNSKTTALLGFISWCWWLKNISQGPLKPGDPESKAAKKAEEGTCQSKDGDKRHGSAQLPFFFFFLHSDFITPSHRPRYVHWKLPASIISIYYMKPHWCFTSPFHCASISKMLARLPLPLPQWQL